MSQEVHTTADLLAGLFFASVGALCFYVSRDYTFGSATSMGPGYFPAMIGAGLMFLGLVIGVRGVYSLVRNRQFGKIEPIDWRGMVAVLAALIAFALTIRTLGLAVAIASICVFAYLSTRDANLRQAGAIFLAIIAISYFVFIKLLSLNINMFGS